MGTSKQSVVQYETYNPATGQGVTISDIERQKKSALIDQSIRNYLTGTAGIKGVTQSPYSGWTGLAERKGKEIKIEAQKPQKIKKAKPKAEVSSTGGEKVKQPTSEAGQFAEEFKKIGEEEAKAKEPHLKMIEEMQKTLNETLKKQDEFLESYKKDVDKTISGIQEIAKKELPAPPKFEDVEKPKNLAQVITKILVPAIVGIATVFRGDKFAGYNYFYFNSMMDALKKNDLETYQKLLNQWEIDYEYAKERKQNELEIAKMELEKIESSAKITSAQFEKQIKTYENRIKQEEKMLEEIDKAFNKTREFLFKIAHLRLEEFKAIENAKYHQEHLKIERAKLAKEGSYKDKLRKEVKETFYKLLKAVNMEHLTREQLAHLLMSAFQFTGIKPDEERFKELYEELSTGLIPPEQMGGETKKEKSSHF